jgi:ATP-dependent DNA helicase RecG
VATLDTRLPDVVGRTANSLEKAFGMRTVADLLRHYPRRMAERGELTDLSQLRLDEDVTVLAEVRSSKIVHSRDGKPRVEVVVSDGSGTLQLVFFGQRQRYLEKRLAPGVRGLFAGRVGQFKRTRQLAHPDFLLLGEAGGDDGGSPIEAYAGALVPVYPATKDLRSWTIGRCVEQALSMLDPVPDPLPATMRAEHRLLDLDTALRAIHRPESLPNWHAARHRLKWDEALGVQLLLAQRRAAAAANPAAPRPPKPGGILAAFDGRLPFVLTDGQRRVGAVIAAELAEPHPMHRLLQGEVGSGKTVVALRAMLQVVDAGGQAALLAPTEVLAGQHAGTVQTLLGPLAQAGQLFGVPDESRSDSVGYELFGVQTATRVAVLTGSQPAAARKAALLDAASGAAGIVIGTHALIQDKVNFADLGLVVVDEQHRFGVEQRDALRGKAASPPHLLVMTATPIPRTVAMTVFGDLETSTLAELPAGRASTTTTVVPTSEHPQWVERVWQRIREEVAAGHQAYVVCPRIGDGETEADALQTPDAEGEDASLRRPPLAVVDVLAMLADGPLHGLRLAPLHGRLPAEERDRTMREFTAGRVDVLVATTVVEVGVDVANATVMAVLDADRFGVSQLHQLRGRIGRGAAPGLCLLVTDVPPGTASRERLDAVAATTDGFELARLDVEQRREGDILGAAQSGRRSQLRLLSLLRDEDLIVAARAEAGALVAADPALAQHPLLAAQLAELAADERAEFLEKA